MIGYFHDIHATIVPLGIFAESSYCNFYTWMRLSLSSHLVACISVCSYNTFGSCFKGIQASFMSALQRLKLLWKREPQLRISVPNIGLWASL